MPFSPAWVDSGHPHGDTQTYSLPCIRLQWKKNLPPILKDECDKNIIFYSTFSTVFNICVYKNHSWVLYLAHTRFVVHFHQDESCVLKTNGWVRYPKDFTHENLNEIYSLFIKTRVFSPLNCLNLSWLNGLKWFLKNSKYLWLQNNTWKS